VAEEEAATERTVQEVVMEKSVEAEAGASTMTTQKETGDEGVLAEMTVVSEAEAALYVVAEKDLNEDTAMTI